MKSTISAGKALLSSLKSGSKHSDPKKPSKERSWMFSYDPYAYGIFHSNIHYLVGANTFLPGDRLGKVEFWQPIPFKDSKDSILERTTQGFNDSVYDKYSDEFWFIAGEGAGDVERLADPDQVIIKNPLGTVLKDISKNLNMEQIVAEERVCKLGQSQGISLIRQRILKAPRLEDLCGSELDVPGGVEHWISFHDIHKLVAANKDLPGNPLQNIEIWRPGRDYSFALPEPYWIIEGDLKALADPEGVLKSTGVTLDSCLWNINEDKIHLIVEVSGVHIGKSQEKYARVVCSSRSQRKNKWRPTQMYGRYEDLVEQPHEPAQSKDEEGTRDQAQESEETGHVTEVTGTDNLTGKAEENQAPDTSAQDASDTVEVSTLPEAAPEDNNSTAKKTVYANDRKDIWIDEDDIPKLLKANQGLPGTPLRNIEIWRPGFSATHAPVLPYFIVSGDVNDLVDPDKVLIESGKGLPWKITDADSWLMKRVEGIVVGEPVPEYELKNPYEGIFIHDPRPSGMREYREDRIEIDLPQFKPGDIVWWDPYADDPEKAGKFRKEVRIVGYSGWGKQHET